MLWRRLKTIRKGKQLIRVLWSCVCKVRIFARFFCAEFSLNDACAAKLFWSQVIRRGGNVRGRTVLHARINKSMIEMDRFPFRLVHV